MKRKVVRHGSSTLTISLPTKWVKSNNIKNGQHLEIESSKDGLTIYPDKTHFDKIETTVSDDKEWYINRILRHLYTYGYDEITVKYSKVEQLALIRRALENLTGFEIIESNSKVCKIKCVASLDDVEYKDTINRVLWLILSQFDYFIEDCERKKPTMYNEVNEIFKTIMKLINLCRRLINKNPPYDAATSKYTYRFLTSIINVSSFVIYSYDYAKKSDKLELTKNEMELVLQVREFYNNLFQSYQNVNVEKTKLFFDQREAMFDDILEVLRDKNPVISHYFLDILKELSSVGNLILILKINEENKAV